MAYYIVKILMFCVVFFFFSSRRRHTRLQGDWSSDVCSSDLPPEAIAQAPALERDAARLLLIDRARGALEDHVVRELPELLRPGDCVVVNDSRVIPARVLALDASGHRVELLFAEPQRDGRWRALVRPGRRCRAGAR